jgi:hypothetical protein
MTRKEFSVRVRNLEFSEAQALEAHDATQRQVIEDQAKKIEFLERGLVAVGAANDELRRAHNGQVQLIEQLEERVKALDGVLKEVLKEAVILSDDYLSLFDDKPLDQTIQGWDKARWLRASAARKRAQAALAATGEKDCK